MNNGISQKHGRFSLPVIVLLLSIFGTYSVKAQVINEQEAYQRAEAFIETHGISDRGPKRAKEAQDKGLELVYIHADKLSGDPFYYVFQQPHSNGFVIASADERVVPIFCYSTEGKFNKDSIPCCIKAIFDGFERQITYARDNNLPKYVSPLNDYNDYPSIYPLTQTHWSQYSPCNLYCPIDKETGERTPVGCVASAQAQIMYYHKWPETGVGSCSYQWRDTTLYANFEETQYLYDSMVPNEWECSRDDVADAMATLNYHCGVSMGMNYSSRGSGAFLVGAKSAMENNFRYKLVLKIDGKTPEDLEFLYDELSHSRPLLADASEAHAVIVDGYAKGGYVHINPGYGWRYCYVSWFGLYGWYEIGDEYIGDEYLEYTDRVQWGGITHCYSLIPDKDIKDIVNDGIKYRICDEKALVVSGDSSGEFIISPTIIGADNKEVKVSQILDRAFWQNKELSSITIPQTIAYIGPWAFCGSGIKSIIIPNSVVSIGDLAFCDCQNLTNITLPESLHRVSSQAFYADKNLTTITLPNSVKYIENDAFENCENLTKVIMPDSLLWIQMYAFNNCKKLSSLTLPKSIIRIEIGAFWDTGLRDLYCERTDPVEYNCRRSAFEGYFDYSKCTFHVPIGCKETYSSLSPWSNFSNIVEDVLDIKSVEEDTGNREESYSIEGKKIDGTPTSKEIFVRNGKKYIVK